MFQNDPLLSLAGSGKDLWAEEHGDEYVQRLRSGWVESLTTNFNEIPDPRP